MESFSLGQSTGRSPTKDFVIDLRTFTCGYTKLGSTPDARDFFSRPLRTSDVYQSARDGFEVGTKLGVLNYIFITLASYQGRFARSGARVALDSTATPERVRSAFGEPYWIDSSDEERILFYEFEGGKIELQFEFPDQKKLGFVTLVQHGVLSDAEQRRLYGVTKAWPPRPDQ
jgi:hypothetical protein